MLIYIIFIIVIINYIYYKENFCENIEKLNNNEIGDVPLVSPYINNKEYITKVINEFKNYEVKLKNYFKTLNECI